MIIYLAAIDAPEDRDTFVALYETYRGLMYHVAHQILRNEADAEDAVHDAFVTVAEKIQIFSSLERHKTRSLLVTIVEHKAIDLYRKKQRRGEAPWWRRSPASTPGPRRTPPPGPVHPPPAWAVPGILPAEVRAGLLHPGGRPADGPVLGRRPKAGAAGQGKTAGTLPGGGGFYDVFHRRPPASGRRKKPGPSWTAASPPRRTAPTPSPSPSRPRWPNSCGGTSGPPARRAMRRVACLVLVCLLGAGVFLTTNAQARGGVFWVGE